MPPSANVIVNRSHGVVSGRSARSVAAAHPVAALGRRRRPSVIRIWPLIPRWRPSTGPGVRERPTPDVSHHMVLPRRKRTGERAPDQRLPDLARGSAVGTHRCRCRRRRRSGGRGRPARSPRGHFRPQAAPAPVQCARARCAGPWTPAKMVPSSTREADMTEIKPFVIAIPDADLTDLRDRLARTRWPEAGAGHRLVPGRTARLFARPVRTGQSDYDWRATETRLNSSTTVHYRDRRGRHPLRPRPLAAPRRFPLILTHGWPGSVVGDREMIGPLTDPTA